MRKAGQYMRSPVLGKSSRHEFLVFMKKYRDNEVGRLLKTVQRE